MKKENENCLHNLRAIAEKLLNAKDETEVKKVVSTSWSWLCMRAIAGRKEPIDKVLPVILEAIEQAYEWGIPTMDEIETRVKPNLDPPDED